MKAVIKTEVIKEMLLKKNMSQNWLAQRVGTTSGYMSQMIKGIRHPSPEMRQKILNILKGKEFDDLFLTVKDKNS